MSKEVPSKGSKKVWGDFIMRLRNKNETAVKDVDSDCEWKWLVSAESEKLYLKVNEEERKVYNKAHENNIQGLHEFERNCVDVE